MSIRGRGLLAVVLGGLSFQSIGVEFPTESQFLAPYRAKDCGVYRAYLSRSYKELATAKKILENHVSKMNEARSGLEVCGKQHGLAKTKGQDVLLAELCPEAYDAWLSPSYRAIVVKEDILTAEKNIAEASQLLKKSCGVLPVTASIQGEF